MSMSHGTTASHPAGRKASGLNSGLSAITKPSESPASIRLKAIESQLPEHQNSPEISRSTGHRTTYYILPANTLSLTWPVNTFSTTSNTNSTASKEQQERINEAIESLTGKYDEIHNCRLGEELIFAKASMTADLASILQNHPDVSTPIKAFTVLLTNVSRLRSCLMKRVLKLRTFRSGASVDVGTEA